MDLILFLSVCITAPITIAFFVWMQLAMPHNDGVGYACGLIAFLVFTVVYQGLTAVGRTRHPVRLCLALLVLIIAVPGWWFAVSQDAWERNHGVFYDPIGLLYAALSMPLALITMLLLLGLFMTTLIMLCCGCCECNVDDEGTRIACCNWGSEVRQGRRRRTYINDVLLHEEIDEQ